MLFRRLWEELGVEKFLHQALTRTHIECAAQEAVFAMVLNRLSDPMSKLALSEWISKEVYDPRFHSLELHHFYRALDMLADHTNALEEDLFFAHRDLFNQELDIVLYDTTTTSFEGSADTLRQRGFSRDSRPDRPQVVVGVLVRKDGIPIAHEVFPDNTADIRTFEYILKRANRRFRIRRVIMVADRAMVSRKTLTLMTRLGYEYILGVKMRNTTLVRDEVLSRRGRYTPVDETLQVKNVEIRNQRYIVCLNPQEAEYDRLTREGILESLTAQLARSRGSLIGYTGYRRYLKVNKDAVEIDEAKVKSEARYDGKYVLMTNTDCDAAQAALAYKQLWRVENVFRELKSTLDLRPVYHWTEKRIRGHIAVCFLALYLEAVFMVKLKEIAPDTSVQHVLRDIKRVKAVAVEVGNRKFITRTDLPGDAYLGFKAVGMRPPSEALEV